MVKCLNLTQSYVSDRIYSQMSTISDQTHCLSKTRESKEEREIYKRRGNYRHFISNVGSSATDFMGSGNKQMASTDKNPSVVI